MRDLYSPIHLQRPNTIWIGVDKMVDDTIDLGYDQMPFEGFRLKSTPDNRFLG